MSTTDPGSNYRLHENPGSNPTSVAADIASINVALWRLQQWSNAHPDVELRSGGHLSWLLDTDHVDLLTDVTDAIVGQPFTTMAGPLVRSVSMDFGVGVRIYALVPVTVRPVLA